MAIRLWGECEILSSSSSIDCWWRGAVPFAACSSPFLWIPSVQESVVKLRALLCVMLIVVWSTAAPALAEELEQLRDGVHNAPPSSPSPVPPSRPCADDDDSFGEELAEEILEDTVGDALGSVVMAGFASLISGPGHERFAGHAEAYGVSGFKDTEWFYRTTDFVCSARGQLEYGTDYNDMQSVGTRLQVDFTRLRSTIDASWNNYYEKTGAGTDHLGLGDANWVFRITQEPNVVSRAGFGINWLADDHSEVGFNFTTGMDVLLFHPIVWSTDLDMGSLGEADLFRIRTTLGAQWREGELYTGLEYVDIEDAQIPQMLFGFRYWW